MSRKKQSSDLINFRGLFRTYAAKWYYFVVSVIVCIILGLLVCQVYKQKYGVRANVLIQTEESSPLAMGDLSDLLGSSGDVNDEIYVINSHSIYREVIRDLGLNKLHYVKTGFLKKTLSYPDFPIDVTAPEGQIDTLRTAINFKVSVSESGLADIKAKADGKTVAKVSDVKLPHTVDTPYGKFTIATTATFAKGADVSTSILVMGYDAAAEDFAEDIVSQIASKKSNVIEMAYDTPNPDMGKALLSDIIKKYNQHGIKEKNRQAENTAEFLDKRLDILMKDLGQTEGDIQNYKEKQGIVDVELETKYQSQKKSNLEVEIIEFSTNAEVLKMTRDFLKDSRHSGDMIPLSVDVPGISDAITDYNKAVIERNQLAHSVHGDNPALRRLDESIAQMRGNLISSINQAYNNTMVAVRDMKAQIGAASGRLGQIPNQERTYVDLERQRKVKQELYIFLLERQEENAIMLANTTPKGQIIDAPYTLNKPLGASKKAILAAFLLLGLCVPPVIIYLKKLIRNRIEARDEIEHRSDVPVLGEMCTDRSGRRMVVSPTDVSSATELFRLMRANLLFMLSGNNDKVVLVTSTTSGEGKSFISMNLAATLSLQGLKVVLIGADIRAPKLAEYLDIAPKFGLTQYLSSPAMTLDQIIVKQPDAQLPCLDVIVSGPVPPNPSELLATRRVDEMVDQLRGMYDYIIIDSAPVGMVSDTFSLNRLSDATVYVTRLEHTKVSDIAFIDDIYTDKRLNNMSLVVNGVKSKKGYGYGGYHTKQ